LNTLKRLHRSVQRTYGSTPHCCPFHLF
jgi:hypothetical protein